MKNVDKERKGKTFEETGGIFRFYDSCGKKFAVFICFLNMVMFLKQMLKLLKCFWNFLPYLIDCHRTDNKRIKNHQRNTRKDHPLDLLVWIWDSNESI